VSFVRDTYETLREVASRGVLEEHFGQAFVQQLEEQVLQRQRTLRSLSIRGQVVAHPVPEAAAQDTETGAQASVSGELLSASAAASSMCSNIVQQLAPVPNPCGSSCSVLIMGCPCWCWRQ
jgi:hypothetical protein